MTARPFFRWEGGMGVRQRLHGMESTPPLKTLRTRRTQKPKLMASPIFPFSRPSDTEKWRAEVFSWSRPRKAPPLSTRRFDLERVDLDLALARAGVRLPRDAADLVEGHDPPLLGVGVLVLEVRQLERIELPLGAERDRRPAVADRLVLERHRQRRADHRDGGFLQGARVEGQRIGLRRNPLDGIGRPAPGGKGQAPRPPALEGVDAIERLRAALGGPAAREVFE